MAKAVFTTKVNPVYDDLPEERYHFPRMYLNQARQTVGDWIVYYEPRREDERPSGRAGRQAYFATAQVTRIEPDPVAPDHFYAYGRPILRQIIERPFRDQAFTEIVRQAYDSTCALTGLRIINGGGRCEIEAAHIRPIQDHGPDSPRNGIALSRTMHWLFDRGLVSLEDNGHILVAKKLVPVQVQRIINPEGYMLPPSLDSCRPHRQFLRYHREILFKG